MATYFPCAETKSSLCQLCNTVQSFPSCCTSSSSKNTTGSLEQKCDVYCNASCNSLCNSSQTICGLHSQYIKNHPDVGPWPGLDRDVRACTATTENPDYQGERGDLISEVWSREFWNSLIKQLNSAETVGRMQKQGKRASAQTAAENGPITLNHYNGLRDKICNFNTSYNKAAPHELITAAKANAMRNAYNAATFNSSVCDVCNSGDQSIHAGCSCNCSCACDCACGCDCPCSCSCSCSCQCNKQPATPS